MSRSDKRDMKIGDIVTWCESRSSMSNTRLGRTVKNVWMDSRKIEKGDVFVALKGEERDGHQYVSLALKSGAQAAIVDKKNMGMFSESEKKKLIPTGDTLVSLQKIAKEYRKRLNIPIIGITGSNGKTTTRRFTASLLSREYNVGQSSSNWNNHIGVPLSLLRLTEKNRIGIIEMGANHLKEIELLSRIAVPDIGIITNVGYAHIGLFGSLKKTATAKLEIVKGMNKRSGLLLLNGDDKVLMKAADGLDIKKTVFGFSSSCNFRAYDLAEDSGGISFVIDGYRYKLKMFGEHFVYNVLPAIYLGIYFGMTHKQISKIVRGLKPGVMRGRLRNKKGVTFIADYYNANPSSMKSAIELLKRNGKNRRKNAVVGDMLELGKYSSKLHRKVGEQLADAGVEKVIAVGRQADRIAEGLLKRGAGPARVICAESVEDALPAARSYFKKGDVVLVKGSRAVNLEELFNKF